MSNRLRLGSKLLLLVVLLVPTVALAADSFSRGNPCHAERTLYYDATGVVVGGNEYVCWEGHYVWGQVTPIHTYEYIGQCCSVCTPQGVCGIEP